MPVQYLNVCDQKTSYTVRFERASSSFTPTRYLFTANYRGTQHMVSRDHGDTVLCKRTNAAVTQLQLYHTSAPLNIRLDPANVQ